ncbi:alpha/beta fold hydrolase [Flexivirga oryzae]|uniref:3-oxoadipate enol-lactonase n=1 Tax=Flexivirga oryzae TaxID=1794944 RepID=A0A839NB82_9MICO|nr:alpha/beta fold hydrolase [Flexivirga oryzae]MBB2891981.1 3-oxoadipate enol-lactonase [Flexivirga oryzae]
MATPEIALTRLAGSAGQPVLVVGPSLGTRVERLWAAVARELPDFRVIGWDLPGHGVSAPADQPYSTPELAGAVLRAMDETVGSTETLYYAGDSFGGCVGLQLILDHPERFAAAAILCSGARIATEEVWRQRIDLVRRAGLAPVRTASSTRWFGNRVQQHPTDESRAVLAELLAVDPTSYCLACEALGTFDVRDRLPGIRVPLLAVAGADDAVTTATQHRELAHVTPGARVEVLDGVGHLAPLEDPLATAALLDKHFRQGVVS